MRVRDLMSQPVRSCRLGETADRAATVMWEADCGAVPIVDGEGRLAGMVTDRDICMAALFHNAPLTDIAIEEVMSTEVCTCRPGDLVNDAERLMSVRQVHRLPVVGDAGQPVGVLSVTDVVRQVRPAPAVQKTTTASDDCLRTLAAISQPRARALMRTHSAG